MLRAERADPHPLCSGEQSDLPLFEGMLRVTPRLRYARWQIGHVIVVALVLATVRKASRCFAGSSILAQLCVMNGLTGSYPERPGLRRRITLGHGFPVHRIPPRLEIIRPAILVGQVIGVFPHVELDDRDLG